MATTIHDQLIHVQPTTLTVRTIPVYACGGGGINIGAALSTLNAPTAEHAIPDVHYIDGSSQNLASIPEKDKDNVYIMRRRDGIDVLQHPDGEELKGGGGDRTFMMGIAANEAKAVLKRWPASDEMNVIIMTAAGSVGSTTGSQIFKQILAEGKPVIVILVSVNASTLRAANTAKTWLTLMQFQKQSGNSAGVFNVINSGASRSAEVEADNKVIEFWLVMSNVLSGLAHRLDARDIFNFLNFNQLFKTDPQLLLVDAFPNGQAMAATKHQYTSIVGIQKEDLASTDAADAVLANVLYTKLGIIASPNPPFTEAYLAARPLPDELMRELDSSITSTQQTVATSATGSKQQSALLNRYIGDDDLGVM